MLGAYLTYSLHVGFGVNPLLTLAVTAPLAFGAGLLLHRLLYARVLSGSETPEALESRSLVISFGALFALQNAALLIWSADLKGYGYLSIPVRMLGAVFPANRIVAAVVALGLSIAFYVFLRRSLAGKAIRGLMQDPEAAELVGIDLGRVHAICFGVGIAMSAVTGSLVSMFFELTPFMGLPYTVTALGGDHPGRPRQCGGKRRRRLAAGAGGDRERLRHRLGYPADRLVRDPVADPDSETRGASGTLRDGRGASSSSTRVPARAVRGSAGSRRGSRCPADVCPLVDLAILADVSLAVSWAFFSGPSRYLSLATGAFFGAGAYTTALTGTRLAWPLPVLAGGAVAAAMAIFVGALALRLRGPYFAIFTFGLAELAKHVVIWFETGVTVRSAGSSCRRPDH
jgi:branched-subunit amino acid ABC-type transport system permease component